MDVNTQLVSITAENTLNRETSYHSFLECPTSITSLILFFAVCLSAVMIAKLVRQKYANELQRADSEKETLLQEIAQQHQLVTNCAHRMQAILSNADAELIRSHTFDSWEVQKNILMEQSSTLRVVTNKLINSDLTRFVTQTKSNHVDTAQVLAKCESLFSKFCEINQQRLIINNSTSATVELPEGLLDKLINRLVTMAIQHSRKGEPVIINASSDEKGFYLCIEDFGKGILFERIKTIQLNTTISRHIGDVEKFIDGTDLLKLEDITRICERFGGSFSLISAVNYATRTYVFFPLSKTRVNHLAHSSAQVQGLQKDCQQTTELTQSESTHNDLPKLSILVSKSTLALRLKEVLQTQFNCESYLSIEAVLDSDLTVLPTAIVIEHGFSGLGATEVLHLLSRIKSLDTPQQLSSLVLLNSQNKDSKLNLLRNGVSAVVNFPYNVNEVAIVLANLVKEPVPNSTSIEEPIVGYKTKLVNASSFMNRFTEILQTNYTDPDFSRDVVANQMHMDTRTLSRKLSEFSGCSFGEHLKMHRLENAKLAILAGSQVSEACYEVGFNNLSHFSTAFKKRYGFAPSKLLSAKRYR